MNCYQCGCLLTENDFCTNCGADVSRYKKIVRLSNKYYNCGLEKAQVRDLSGAIVCLRQSIKMNKNNIEARNLLGLVYFEMGETVTALKEWVISKNIQPKKNVADDYINTVQANKGRLDDINKTIKQYNKALAYCQQDSLDLAVIQLKAVLSKNPKYVQAHQLLALVYMNIQEWAKAKRELQKCLAIDTNNTTTLRYLNAIDGILNVDEDIPQIKKKKEKRKENTEEEFESNSAKTRDVVINPIDVREPNGISTLLNIIIGVVIGVAIAWFLILPARINNEKNASRAEIEEHMELVTQRNEEIDRLREECESLELKAGELENSLSSYSGTHELLAAYEKLTYAQYLFFAEERDVIKVAEALKRIEDSEYQNGTENFKASYDKMLKTISPEVSQTYYKLGKSEYEAKDYATAIMHLALAYQYNENDSEALYFLGNAYRLNENVQEAIDAYNALITKFPDSKRVSSAKKHLKKYE